MKIILTAALLPGCLGTGTVRGQTAASGSLLVLAKSDQNVSGANRLKFTPDGTLVLVSTLRGPNVVIINAGTRHEVKRLKVGRGAAGIQMQPDGARAYVACTPDNTVAVLDLKSLEVVGRIDAGGQPDGLAWVPAASR